MIQFVFFYYLITEIPPLISDYIASDFYFEFVVELFFLLSAVLTVFLSVKILDKRDFRELGLFINKKWITEFGIGLALGAGVFILIFAIQFSAGWIKIDSFMHNETGLPFVIAIVLRLLGYVAVGITEELFCRGYQLKNIAEGFHSDKTGFNYSIIAAWIITSIIFGLLHAENPSANLLSTFNLFLIGLFFGLTYILTGSLALPIGLHTTWNFFQGNIFSFPVSGFDAFVSFFKTSVTTPGIVSDSRFGPEAGLIIFPGLIAGILFLYYFYKKETVKQFLIRSIALYKSE
ncbi:MAG: protease [Melioribacteraceae bacterium]|nr:MAG: protease [Melioribacteraceae bacterium]